MKSRNILLALTLSGLLLTSLKCKKENPPAPNTSGFTLDFKGQFDGTPIEYKTGEYTMNNNQLMRISNWAMILSHVSLVKTDDTKVQLGDGYLFVDFVGGKVTKHFDNIPYGDYKGVSFLFGLDSAINHGDPAAWPADHPLSASTGLNWGWAGGYIFQAIDGNWRPDASASWNGMSLHTVGDNYTKQFMLPVTFSINNNNGKTINILTNIAEYFKNPYIVDFATDGSYSHSIGSSEITLMDKITGNSGDVFTAEEVK